MSSRNQTHLHRMIIPVLDNRATQLVFLRFFAGAFAAAAFGAAAFGAALALPLAFGFAFPGVLPAPDLPPTVLSLQGIAGIS